MCPIEYVQQQICHINAVKECFCGLLLLVLSELDNSRIF